jgi:hypothetical protein
VAQFNPASLDVGFAPQDRLPSRTRNCNPL